MILPESGCRMADLLKISTPLVDKNPIPAAAAKPQTPGMPFELSDITRVMQPKSQSELLGQSNGLVPRETSPKILEELLKDPSVTVSMMRNIYLLQEVVRLLPAANTPLTDELQGMFEALMVKPGDIQAELMRQEDNTTLFKGELFDQLRTLLYEAKGDVRLTTSIGVFLKGLNAMLSGRDTLDSVANNLQFLLDSLLGNGLTKSKMDDIDFSTLLRGGFSQNQLTELLSQSRLTDKLDILIGLLRAQEAPNHFSMIKEGVLQVLPEVEKSLMFSSQTEKILPLIVYNLSRYNDNESFLPNALQTLLENMQGDVARENLLSSLEEYLSLYRNPEGARQARAAEADSQVIDMLAKIIDKQAESPDVRLVASEKLESIVHSMLASPSNFTPLLHFILPVDFMDVQAFAEIWIDPNAEGESATRGGKEMGTHMLMVFDIEGFGRFEAELYVQDNRLALNLLCPASAQEAFAGIGPALREAVSASGYRFETIHVDRLERTHSLMDVFTNLPYKRMGIDVKV